MGLRLVAHARDYGTVAVERLVHVVELLTGSTDVRAGAVDVERLRCRGVLGSTGDDRAAEVGAVPRRGQRIGHGVVVRCVGEAGRPAREPVDEPTAVGPPV